MNRDKTKQFLPLMQAFAEGKILQYRSNTDYEWEDTECLLESLPFENYRIKSTPSLRPWKPEEVPVGALVRYKNQNANNLYLITGRCSPEIYVNGATSPWTNIENFMNTFEHSLDHGKTWLPCGVVE